MSRKSIFTKEIGSVSFIYTLFLAFGIFGALTKDYFWMGLIVAGISLLLLTIRTLSWTEVS